MSHRLRALEDLYRVVHSHDTHEEPDEVDDSEKHKEETDDVRRIRGVHDEVEGSQDKPGDRRHHTRPGIPLPVHLVEKTEDQRHEEETNELHRHKGIRLKTYTHIHSPLS